MSDPRVFLAFRLASLLLFVKQQPCREMNRLGTCPCDHFIEPGD
nr:MAG TPA: hypothetical protein [Caudoviricetes sp.]